MMAFRSYLSTRFLQNLQGADHILRFYFLFEKSTVVNMSKQIRTTDIINVNGFGSISLRNA